MRTRRRTRRAPVAVAMVALLSTGGCGEPSTPERAEVDPDTGEAGVPIRLTGPGGAALLVPVRINGEGSYDFVLDTGATLTCLDDVLADSLGLQDDNGRVAMGTTLGGATGSIRLVEIDSLSVGDARAEGLTGCSVDLEQFRAIGLEAHGLLGLNFLTSFRVTLDFAAERLILDDG